MELKNIESDTQNKGFTLIELIVVIAIIGILAGVIIIRVSDYSARARDARRLHDVDEIAKALDMYKIRFGYYPKLIPAELDAYSTPGETDVGCWGPWDSGNLEIGPIDKFIPDLEVAGLVGATPRETRKFKDKFTSAILGPRSDPQWNNGTYCTYKYVRQEDLCSSGKTYAVVDAALETDWTSQAKNGEMPKELKDIGCSWSEGESAIQSYAKYLPE